MTLLNPAISCEIVHYGRSKISIFEETFANIDKTLILWGRLDTGL